jgi:hypothetical protein
MLSKKCKIIEGQRAYFQALLPVLPSTIFQENDHYDRFEASERSLAADELTYLAGNLGSLSAIAD